MREIRKKIGRPGDFDKNTNSKIQRWKSNQVLLVNVILLTAAYYVQDNEKFNC